MLLVGLTGALTHPAAAANLLVNPGFESDPPGESQNLLAWNWFGQPWGNTFNETGPLAHTGSNYFKVFQGFTGAVNFNGAYEDIASGLGATYAASGWAYTSGGDRLAGQNVAWIEVTFRDAFANILALYRSALVTTNLIGTSAFPLDTWVNLPITNQYDPSTFEITNTVSRLVAPPGTSFARCQVTLQGDPNTTGGAVSGGSMYFDDLELEVASGSAWGNWNLVWSDEFNGSSINPAVWTFDLGNNSGWGNSEMEYYTSRPQNAFVSGGLLHIVARQESYSGYNYTSARMKTEGLFSHTHGRIEFRARLPQGLGFWPALWMLGTNITSVGWPACGEIDVMENNGGYPTNVQGSIHSDTSSTAIYTLPGGSVTNFHSYLLEWDTNSILWYVDGLLYETQTSWSNSMGTFPAPFDKPFFLIMNVAIGGSYLGYPSAATINANTVFPAEMQVDYVRIYELTQPLALSIANSNNAAVLTWPASIVCHLQTRTNLNGAAAAWIDLATPSNRFVAPPADAGALYRLASP